jgi:hypothetical protein
MNKHNENETPEEVAEEFHITDDKSAEWVLRKIAECDAHTERTKAWAEEITQHNEKRKQRLLERFGVELEAYAQERLKDAKTRSFKLPSGKLGFRSTTPQLVVRDENVYSKWVETNLPSALRLELEADVSKLSRDQLWNVKTSLDSMGVLVCVESTPIKSVVNDYFKESGIVPDGCDFVPAEDKFYVK